MKLPQSLEKLDNMFMESIDKIIESPFEKSRADKTVDLFLCLGIDFFVEFPDLGKKSDRNGIDHSLESIFTNIWKFVESGYLGEIDEESESLSDYYPFLFKGIPSIFYIIKKLKNKNHIIIMLKIIQVICANQLKVINTYEPELIHFKITTIDEGLVLLNKGIFGNGKSKLDLSKIEKLNFDNNYLDMIIEIVQISRELDVYFSFYVNENLPKDKSILDPRIYIHVFTVMIYLCCIEYYNNLK